MQLQARVSLSTFAPKAVAGEFSKPGSTINEIPVGVILGIARKIKRGTGPDGVTPYEGLVGEFECMFADGRESVGSGVCFLPDAFQEPIIAILEDEKSKGEAVEFRYGVSIVKSGNPQGYSWQLTPLGEMGRADPLALARQQIASDPKMASFVKPAAAAIADQSKAAK